LIDVDIATVRRNTKLPIPKIIAWSDNDSNPVGSEYILMEHADGVELRKIWFDLDSDVQLNCIRNITSRLEDMTQLRFPAYGSLYLRGSDVTSAKEQILIDEEFCIGPHCGKTYWDCTVGEKRYYDRVAPDRGPCKWHSARDSFFILNHDCRLHSWCNNSDQSQGGICHRSRMA